MDTHLSAKLLKKSKNCQYLTSSVVFFGIAANTSALVYREMLRSVVTSGCISYRY